MKKLLLVCLFLTILTGCQNKDENVLDFNESLNNNEDYENIDINARYNLMNEQLISYGKLIFENDEWLNINAKPVTMFVSLTELSEKFNYDVSMFFDPETGVSCNFDNSGIEFIISEVIAAEDIDYKFNPILKCDLDGEIRDNKYNQLIDVFTNYINDIYNKMDNEDIKLDVYKITLKNLQFMGYDISMFVNPINNTQCNLDKTYAEFTLLDISEDGNIDHDVKFHFSC